MVMKNRKVTCSDNTREKLSNSNSGSSYKSQLGKIGVKKSNKNNQNLSFDIKGDKLILSKK